MAETRFRKGDRVRFKLGLRWVHGTVTEDRGPLGVNGRHLYEVVFHEVVDPGQPPVPQRIELPAAHLKAVRRRVATR